MFLMLQVALEVTKQPCFHSCPRITSVTFYQSVCNSPLCFDNSLTPTGYESRRPDSLLLLTPVNGWSSPFGQRILSCEAGDH